MSSKKQSSLSLIRKVTYTVTTSRDRVTIVCHLPAGFTMREYTRTYKTKTADSFDMSLPDYIEWEKERLLEDLLNRINIPIGKSKLLEGNNDKGTNTV